MTYYIIKSTPTEIKNTPNGVFFISGGEYACINQTENEQESSNLMQQVKELKRNSQFHPMMKID